MIKLFPNAKLYVVPCSVEMHFFNSRSQTLINLAAKTINDKLKIFSTKILFMFIKRKELD
ncbi:hypothetical protein BpHYR1_012433 [Brachionus plicatilis]|uniref:Uncharacterized protein n=1 Tax=Brachionus plicatilis TaxID=10195 RepID=A0A3M7SND0_BRAPC|nr:hypothetical protein BpHYR1_012433 [Brachionus plicatilis]